MMKRLSGLVICVAFAGAVAGDIISFQDPDTGDAGYSAQVFEERYDDYNIYQLDDLNLGPRGCRLESAAIYWVAGIVAPEYYRIRTYSDLPTSGWDIDQYFLKEYCGVTGEYDAQGRWVVTFDLGGDLYNGTIWIAGYVRADYEGDGRDGWYNANAENLGYQPNGSEEYFWWWGTGWMPPMRGHHVYQETADMSWKIEGTPVPEPGLLALVVVGMSACSLLRRTTRR